MHLGFKSLNPNIYLTDTGLSISKKQYQISSNIPLDPNFINNQDDVASLFHYGSRNELRPIIDKIKYWMAKFGYKEFISQPERDLKLSLQFNDEATSTKIDLNYGGSGISSLIFLIAELEIAKPGDLLLIDEPELHLHAKSQALLLDLFLETVSRGVQIIIATHSDYLLLRLQRRIAEKDSISHNSVAIYEIKRQINKGSSAVRIELSKDGSYMSSLPESMDFVASEFREMNSHRR